MVKIIDIADIGSGYRFRLDGTRLIEIDNDDEPVEILERDLVDRLQSVIHEDMDDDEIRDALWDAWTVGHDGDPRENGLVIHVREE